MADCNLPNYIGRTVPWEFFTGCGDVDPTDPANTWLPVGSLNNKTWNLTTSETDNTSDDTQGVMSSLITYLTLESTASGFATAEDGTLGNQALLMKYLVSEVVDNQRQPSLWVRVTFPDVTVYAFVNMTANNRSMSSTETVTFEISVKSTATGTSQAAIVIEDTP